jgi:spermidine export protein MdtI
MGETHDEPTTAPAASAVLALPDKPAADTGSSAVLVLSMTNRPQEPAVPMPQGGPMHPLIIVLGAALLDIGANMAINRSVGFRHKGWGFLGILLVLCAFTLLGGGQYRQDRSGRGLCHLGCHRHPGHRPRGLLLFGERLRPIGWLGMMVMAVAVALLTTA